MTPHLTLSQLEQYLSKAAWILKGPIGASDFKAYIFPLFFFKRICDVYDEVLEESHGDKDYARSPVFHRFSDETLVNLLEHFSARTLSIVNVPDDQLGNTYESRVPGRLSDLRLRSEIWPEA